jgi:hypothetical protein
LVISTLYKQSWIFFMPSKEPVWLSTDDLIKKYFDFCFQRNINERFLVKLFDAHLLRGQTNRRLKKVEILEESFLELLKHINYNLQKQMYYSNEEKISVPIYCLIEDNTIRYNIDRSWYTASDLMNELPSIKQHKIYTVDFINELMLKGILRGRYDKTEKIGFILLPSFIELIKYRDYTLTQNLFYPPPK